MVMPESMPVWIMRGGTSRGVFVRLDDLPDDRDDRDDRDALCIALIGSPDPVAIDGLGGGVSSNSKVMGVGRPASFRWADEFGVPPEDADLVSVFAQVAPDRAVVDWVGNCGNLSTAVSLFADAAGVLPLAGPGHPVRVWNANTRATFELEQLEDAAPAPGSARRFAFRFLRPGGEFTGTTFPAGRRTRLPDAGVEATLIDCANPLVVLRADAVGVDVSLPPARLNEDRDLLDRMEQARREGAQLMGLPDSPAIPRVSVVGAGGDDSDVVVRTTSMQVFHHAIPVTAALAVAATAALDGTVLAGTALRDPDAVVVAHPKGEVTVGVRRERDDLAALSLERTARVVLSGSFHVDRS